ncbi:hypothetical protein OUZ56_027935 [Daphnia magna]|uniref:Uncharacterized protein n=1 Tax=Daphnia magna TaxID=35525 RepID=A0ABR0B2C9_9CRUS|nr:hypothetical protein OUZ56_027935 [Daphnia magna]
MKGKKKTRGQEDNEERKRRENLLLHDVKPYIYMDCLVVTEVLFSFARLSPLVDLKLLLMSTNIGWMPPGRRQHSTPLPAFLLILFIFSCLVTAIQQSGRA